VVEKNPRFANRKLEFVFLVRSLEYHENGLVIRIVVKSSRRLCSMTEQANCGAAFSWHIAMLSHDGGETKAPKCDAHHSVHTLIRRQGVVESKHDQRHHQ